MGNISQKLTYLNGTKTKIREGLNSLGADLDTEDTFRSYVDAIDEIYEDYPKITGEGESLSLDNTKQASMQIDYKGNTSQTGTPTPSSPIPINVVSGDNTIDICGKNWMPNNATTQTINGITFTINSDKSITMNGTASSRADLYIYGQSTDNGKYLKIPKGVYSIDTSKVINGKMFYLFREKTAGVTFATSNNSSTISLMGSQDCYFYGIMLAIESGTTLNNYTIYPMLNKGTTLATYEPYIGNTHPISLGSIELCKIGTYQDYIYKNNGVWYLHKEIGKLVSTSTSDWSADANNRYYRNITNIVVPPNNDTVGQGYCNVRLVTANQTLQASTTPGLAIHPISRLYISKVVYDNLPTTPIVLYYAYITPTNTEITDTTLLEQLEESKLSYISQTNISQVNNDLPIILDVKALRGE